MERDKNLIWVDLEMTGLDLQKDVILEIASVITDSQLNLIEVGPHVVIHQSDSALNSMNKEVTDMHKKSGLINEVKKSTINIDQAEKETLEFYKKYCDSNTALLAGNSVWQDKYFLKKYMPSLVDFCYYRILDVTSIKEVIQRWYPDDKNNEYKKKEVHRALDDIFESIEELKHFRKHFFVNY